MGLFGTGTWVGAGITRGWVLVDTRCVYVVLGCNLLRMGLFVHPNGVEEGDDPLLLVALTYLHCDTMVSQSIVACSILLETVCPLPLS